MDVKGEMEKVCLSCNMYRAKGSLKEHADALILFVKIHSISTTDLMHKIDDSILRFLS